MSMNPEEPAALPKLGSPTLPKLGSLAQTAREKSLNQVRGWLIFLGIVTALINLVLCAAIPSQVHQEVVKGTITPDLEETVTRIAYLIQGGGVLVGMVFLLFGLYVKRFPVPITISSLALFIGYIGINAALEPASLVQGWIIKIIVFGVLANGIKAAIAYQREKALDAQMEPTA